MHSPAGSRLNRSPDSGCSGREGPSIVFEEHFNTETSSTAQTLASYPAFSYDGSESVQVVGGVLTLQQVGGPVMSIPGFPGDLQIDVGMGAVDGPVGYFAVNLVIGENRIAWHPGYGGGAFRVSGPGGFPTQDMGFTPALGVLHHLTVNVTAASGRFEISVRDGANPANVYTTSFTNPGYVPGCRIGLSAESIYGSTLIFDDLVIHGPEVGPSIATHPQSQAVAVGNSGSFGVSATGTPPLSFQWRKDGADLANGGRISGVTTTNLTIDSVQLGDAGSYQVIVANSFGSATSHVAVLTVGKVPGMISWWRAEGNANDSVGANHGTLLPGASYVPGVIGQAFAFDGVEGGIEIPDSPSLSPQIASGEVSLETWIKLDEFPGPSPFDVRHPIGKAGPLEYGFGVLTNGVPGFAAWQPDGQGIGAYGTSLTFNAWHHLVGTFKRTGEKTLIATDSSRSPLSPSKLPWPAISRSWAICQRLAHVPSTWHSNSLHQSN